MLNPTEPGLGTLGKRVPLKEGMYKITLAWIECHLLTPDIVSCFGYTIATCQNPQGSHGTPYDISMGYKRKFRGEMGHPETWVDQGKIIQEA